MREWCYGKTVVLPLCMNRETLVESLSAQCYRPHLQKRTWRIEVFHCKI
jgi:hypothetical protein